MTDTTNTGARVLRAGDLIGDTSGAGGTYAAGDQGAPLQQTKSQTINAEDLFPKPTLEQLSGKNRKIHLGNEPLHLIEGPTGQAVRVQGERILLSYNNSDESRIAADYVLKTITPKDHVFIVNILPTSAVDQGGFFASLARRSSASSSAKPAVSPPPKGDSSEDSHQLLRLRSETLESLRVLAKKIEERGARTTIHITHGDPRLGIIALADFNIVSLIVLGRRNKIDLVTKVLTGGSVSDQIIRNSTQNVLIVKA